MLEKLIITQSQRNSNEFSLIYMVPIQNNPNNQMIPYEQKLGDSGEEKFPFKRKKALAQGGVGGWGEKEEHRNREDKKQTIGERRQFNSIWHN